MKMNEKVQSLLPCSAEQNSYVTVVLKKGNHKYYRTHEGTGEVPVQLFSLQYSTVQYSTVQYSTVQYRQYSTVQYSSVQYSTIRYSTVQYSTVQCTVKFGTFRYSNLMFKELCFCKTTWVIEKGSSWSKEWKYRATPEIDR